MATQTTLTSDGRPLYWVNKNIPLSISTNTFDLNSADTRSIILNSMIEWNSSSTAQLREASSANQIRFERDFSIYGSAVVGLTELSYNSSGVIQKAVILLNDNYTFMATPGVYSVGSVFLGDVVSHEMGHLFGLGHSEVLNSTMFYSAFSGQSTLSKDDKAGIKQKYDSGFGMITGRVQGGNAVPILGAHVQAISRKTGESVGAVTYENGRFEISGLDLDDSYYLYTSPLKNISSLPTYFSNMQTQFCPGSYVGGFFTFCGNENDGFPQAFSLRAGNAIKDVGVITINCSLRAMNDYKYQKIQATFAPVIIWEGQAGGQDVEKAFVGYFNRSTTWAWSTPDLLKVDLTQLTPTSSTTFNVRLVGQPFGNLLEYDLTLKQNGIPIRNVGLSNSAITGTYTTDLSLSVPLTGAASQNLFEIEIKARKLTSNLTPLTFPSPQLFTSEKDLPYLLIMGINSGSSLLFNSVPLLSDNSACLDAPYAYNVLKSKPLTDSSSKQDKTAAALAACATTGPSDSGPGPGTGMLILLGFMLPFGVMMVGKKTKFFLS